MLNITGISVRDFQGHTRTSLNLGTLTFLRGANGTGKSSVRRALEWVFTNQVSDLGITVRGAAEVLIRGYGTLEGAAKAVVVVELAQGGKVMRELPKGFKAHHPVTLKVIDEEQFGQAHRLPAKEMIAAACNPGYLIDMKSDALRDLLFAVLTDGMARTEVSAAIREWLSIRPEVQAEVGAFVLDFAGKRLPEWPNVHDLDRLYKLAYDARREANGAVRTLKLQLQSLKAAATSTAVPSSESPDQVRARLSAFREQSKALQQRLAEAQELARRKAAAKKVLDDTEQLLAERRSKTGLAAGEGHAGDEAGLRAQIATLAQQVRTAREQSGACPVYVGVSCPLPSEAAHAHLGKLNQQRQALVHELAQVIVHDAAAGVRAARAAYDALPADSPEALEPQLNRLNQRIDQETEHLQQLATAIGLRTGAAETAAMVRAQLAQAEVEAARLNWAVKCFDTGGIRA